MRIAIAGATGRMGRTLIEAVLNDSTSVLAGALEVAGHAGLGRDAGDGLGVQTKILVTSDIDRVAAATECLIDFTRPTGTLAHLEVCARAGAAMVIGTTGFESAQKAKIAEYACRVPVVMAPNMAIGVNATFKLAAMAAKILGDSYDVEIIEAHHRHKVDAPSGTALKLGEMVANALGRDLSAVAKHGREGITGERETRTIGFHSIRGGDIVGDHTVIFAGEGERVEITVRSGSRMTYALGALRAAHFLKGRAPGLYDMFDVLELR
jgi:4-hydroxy-tetrahydrodipicolinate reductase